MKKLVTLILSFLLYSLSFAGGLITPEKINEIKNNENVVILDYRWDKIPEKTIPGAMLILNSDVARTINNVPGMVLPKDEFEKLMSSKGIKETDTIVLTDNEGMMNASRLWWILKLYGHKGEIFILDGQIAAWEKSGLPMEKPATPSKTTKYVALDANKDLVATLDEVKAAMNNPKMKVIDTRSKMERVKGHIPKSVFIEWTNNLTPEGKYKSKEELQKMYTDAGITKDLQAIMPHCKSAVRATHTMFALVEILGYNNVKNYDGSWLEYEVSDAPKSYGF